MVARLFALIFSGVIFLSCSSDPYPPILETPTYSYRYGEFVWHEMATTNLEVSKSFYKDLFNWEYTEFDTDGNIYVLIKNEGKFIGGMIGVPNDNSSAWISTISVEDTEDAVQRAITNGADVLINTVRITGRGKMAMVRDPQGAFISFIHSNSGDPVIEEVNSHEWLWTELWSDQPEESGNYYSSLFGYSVNETSVDDKPYWVLNSGERKIAGMLKNPVSNMKSQWIPYIKVTDPVFIAQKAKKLGATILLEPSESIRNASVAVIADPNGAIFCLQKWPVR